jgi:hypothetical protein
MKTENTLHSSQYRLRIAIGLLGMVLPAIVLAIHGKLLSSISHYYYTPGGIFYIGILFAMSLILVTYEGHSPSEKEKYSDNQVTSLAGICAMIMVIVPAKCMGAGDVSLCFNLNSYLFGHNDLFLRNIHNISTGIFIFLLGWMCVKKFSSNKEKPMHNRFYKGCGYIVWLCIASLTILFAIEDRFDLNKYVWGYTFYLETIAIWAFALAWLVKGKVDDCFKG